MISNQTKGLALVLIAQVTLCLAFAPVIAARQSWEQNTATPGQARPHDGATIQAATDAVNARPEDESEIRRKTGKPRTPLNGRGRSRFSQLASSMSLELLSEDAAPALRCASRLTAPPVSRDAERSANPTAPEFCAHFALQFSAIPTDIPSRLAQQLFAHCVQPTGPPIA